MNNKKCNLRAMVDFICLDDNCTKSIAFNVMELAEKHGDITCPECHRAYSFDENFIDKLQRLKKLILSVIAAEDILGDVNIAVTTAHEEIKIPYRLLLTRLNSIITIDVGDKKVDFTFRIEPLNNGKFK